MGLWRCQAAGGTLYLGCPPRPQARAAPMSWVPLTPSGPFFLHLQIANKHPWANPAPHTTPWQLVPGKHRGAAGRRGLQGAP